MEKCTRHSLAPDYKVLKGRLLEVLEFLSNRARIFGLSDCKF